MICKNAIQKSLRRRPPVSPYKENHESLLSRQLHCSEQRRFKCYGFLTNSGMFEFFMNEMEMFDWVRRWSNLLLSYVLFAELIQTPRYAPVSLPVCQWEDLFISASYVMISGFVVVTLLTILSLQTARKLAMVEGDSTRADTKLLAAEQ